MGHCYEFGVSITAGCAHAMTVSPAGGACECPTCAAHCEGRFAGCAGVLCRPGYTPAVAPSWASSRVEPPEQHSDGFVARRVDSAELVPAPEPEQAFVDLLRCELESTRAELQGALDRVVNELRTEMLVSVQSVALERSRHERDAQDQGLASALGQVAQTYEGLATRLEADRLERAALAQALMQLTEWLALTDPGQAARSRGSAVLGGSVNPALAPTGDEHTTRSALGLAPVAPDAIDLDLVAAEREIEILASSDDAAAR